MKMIKITTAGEVSVVDVKTDFRSLAKEIGADYIQLVRMNTLDLEMVVDEEGLLVDDPVCNPVASILYGTLRHLQPIMGDALVFKPSGDENGFAP